MLKNLRTRKEQSASNTGKYTYGQDSDITIEEPDLAFSWGDNVIEMTT